MSVLNSRTRRRRRRARAAVMLMLLAALVGAVAYAGDDDSTEVDLQQGDLGRHYQLYVPPGSAPAGGRPLIVALHGGLGTGAIMETQSGLDRIADSHNVVIAYPDGVGRAWNAGSCCGRPMDEHIDDVAFVRQVITDVERRTPIDHSRVYGTGFSNGAMLLHRIVCEAPDTFTAVAAVSGGVMVQDCSTRHPVPALLIQGRADKRIPWNGGTFRGTFRPSMQTVVGEFGRRNGCSNDADEIYDADGVQCHKLQKCASGDGVEWCGLQGVGHQWPGGKTYLRFLLGDNNERFSASQHIWTFFSQYRGPTSEAAPAAAGTNGKPQR
ncbi:alpha/beta hydrolase family esterase [Solimonas marina]|uniref:Polyhydroxybutyrate depolymerase n=1 Tax=Solimonas marina TaxID=2714601 RepID=A0A969W7N6_9GAMM|nr:PHB depolymerase family esterase [Solimonas marina]NKF21404.1 hypothetical protein [Solimonas marina]